MATHQSLNDTPKSPDNWPKSCYVDNKNYNVQLYFKMAGYLTSVVLNTILSLF